MFGSVKAFALAALAGGCAIPAAAQGSQNCAPRDVVLERLKGQFGEARQTFAITGEGALLEQFANLQTGTWSLLITRPGGPTCLVSAGSFFAIEAARPGGDPA